jgi:hypothetical protein
MPELFRSSSVYGHSDVSADLHNSGTNVEYIWNSIFSVSSNTFFENVPSRGVERRKN